MNILSSILAFAGLMVVFSTIVSGVVETLIGLLRMRSRNLKHMLRSFLVNELNVSNPDDVVEALRNNPVSGGHLAEIPNSSRIDWLTPMAFFQRLARTPVGKQIGSDIRKNVKLKGDQYKTDKIKFLEITYDRYAAASSEVLRKNSYVSTFLVAIIFAFAFNVNAETVFVKLLNEPDIRQEIIANIQGEKNLPQNLNAVEKAINATIPKIEQGKLKGNAADEKIDELKDQLENAVKSMDGLSGSGLPIGWTKTTWNEIGSGPYKTPILNYANWIFFTLVAGFLISLGGPFWYRVFSNLSGLIGALRTFTGKNPELVEDKKKEKDSTPKNSDERTKQLADAFMLVFNQLNPEAEPKTSDEETNLGDGTPGANTGN